MNDLKDTIDYTEFDYEMSVRGWTMFPNVIPKEFCNRMRDDISGHITRCGELQVKAGIPGAPDGTSHHTIGFGDSLDEFLEKRLLANYIERFFSGPYILHAFNPVTNSPGSKNYISRIHKDVRTYTESFGMLLNMLVMVDEFTLENGATHIISGSHHESSQPSETFFLKHAERITGTQGSIVLFDSRCWHSGGAKVLVFYRKHASLSLIRMIHSRARRLVPLVEAGRYTCVIPQHLPEFWR